MPSSSCSPIRLSNIWPPPGAPWTSPWKRDSKHWRRSVSWKCCQRMPPAITASPHLMTPSRAYCTALTLRFPRPFPCRVCGCPLGKNCSLNVFLNEYSYFTDFQCFGLGRKLRYKVDSRRMPRYFRVSYHQKWPRTHFSCQTTRYLALAHKAVEKGQYSKAKHS